jgi:hypothetical protein
VVEAGTSHVFCWGYNGAGSLGAPTPEPYYQSSVPLQVMVPE